MPLLLTPTLILLLRETPVWKVALVFEHGLGDRVQLAPTTCELDVSELYTTAGVSPQP